MGTLVHRGSGKAVVLEHEHPVGRGSSCALCIAERYVSAQHALVRWTGEHWELRDLGSRNGTFLNGIRLAPGECKKLDEGSLIAFGKLEQEWALADVSVPTTMVVPLDGGEPISVDGDLVAIPSQEDPAVTLYRTADGTWILEQAISATPIANQQRFSCNGRTWKFCSADGPSKTSFASVGSLEVKHLQLQFSVSADEEHVHLQAVCATHKFDLGERGHNYFLLTLARRRIEDAREGLPESRCGWVYQDDLAHDPSMAPPKLDIDVFRIRKQFAAAGIIDAANIVERRPRTKQIRIGAHRLIVVSV